MLKSLGDNQYILKREDRTTKKIKSNGILIVLIILFVAAHLLPSTGLLPLIYCYLTAALVDFAAALTCVVLLILKYNKNGGELDLSLFAFGLLFLIFTFASITRYRNLLIIEQLTMAI